MQGIHLKYVQEEYDSNGMLSKFHLNVPENFNFAYDVVDELARTEPGRTALVWCGADGSERRFTFAEIKEYSDRAAAFFMSLGIGKGDIVMLTLRRHYEFWFSIIALHKIGAVAAPAAVSLTAKDLEYRFHSADVRAIVCTATGSIADYVDKAALNSPSLRTKILVNGKRDGWQDFEEGLSKAKPFVRPQGPFNVGDPMLMYFTSGTSAQPKMVMHSFAYPLAHIVTAKHWQHVDPEGLHLSVSDTGWGKAAWGKLYGQWLMETAVFVYDFDEFYPDDLLEKMEKYHITTFCAPPTVYRYFIKLGMKGYDLSSLKYVTTAGEALNPEVFNRFKEMTGLPLMEGYGQTETTLTVSNLFGSEPRSGSMGKPSPLYDIDILDENGNPTKPGETGEIIVRIPRDGLQPGLCTEYYLNPELTAHAWRGGVFHTGDTARRDEDGYFWYVGRVDDLIKSSGYRISPFEVESVLMEHPSVLECAVTGIPDVRRGQAVKASVVLTRDYSPSRELAAKLREYVKTQTASYKCPRVIDFVEELPKTISGKIRRVEIREKDLRQDGQNA
jgi:acetyl-CoA synthetase